MLKEAFRALGRKRYLPSLLFGQCIFRIGRLLLASFAVQYDQQEADQAALCDRTYDIASQLYWLTRMLTHVLPIGTGGQSPSGTTS